MISRKKYIYFAGDNLLGTKYYRRAIIVGETTDLIHRQCMYAPGKGMAVPATADLVSYSGLKNLPWPFMDYFEAPGDISDKEVHGMFVRARPFKDFVYPIRDMQNMHTKEAFGFWSGVPLEEAVAQLKRLLLEYLE
jgi:hypothetical protein